MERPAIRTAHDDASSAAILSQCIWIYRIEFEEFHRREILELDIGKLDFRCEIIPFLFAGVKVDLLGVHGAS